MGVYEALPLKGSSLLSLVGSPKGRREAQVTCVVIFFLLCPGLHLQDRFSPAFLKFLTGVTYNRVLKTWSVGPWGLWDPFRGFEVKTTFLIILNTLLPSLCHKRAVGFSRGCGM